MNSQISKNSIIQIRINALEKEKWIYFYQENNLKSLSELIRTSVNNLILKDFKIPLSKKEIKLKKDSFIILKISDDLKNNWMMFARKNHFRSISKLIRYSVNKYIQNEYYYKLNKKQEFHHVNYNKYDNNPENLIAINLRSPFNKQKKEEPLFKLNNITYNMIETIKELYLESEKESNMLKKIIIKKLPRMSLVSLNKMIITVNSANYFEELNSINISHVIVYISKNGKIIKKYLSEVSILPFQNPLSIIFILRETLKYKVILDILNEKEYETRNPDLILIEGTISSLQEKVFESLNNENEIIRKYMENFIEITNKFFNILKERNIPIIALDKANVGIKYFNSLSNHIDNDFDKLNNQDSKILLDIESKAILKNWRRENRSKNISGELMSFYVFRNCNSFNRTLALPLSKGYGFQTDIIVNNLKEGNLLGLLISSSGSPTYYLEIPLYFEELIDDILKMFMIMCYNSIIPDFPMPLYLVNMQLKLLNNEFDKIIPYLQREPLVYKNMKSKKNEIIEYMNDFIELLNKKPIEGVLR